MIVTLFALAKARQEFISWIVIFVGSDAKASGEITAVVGKSIALRVVPFINIILREDLF